MATYAVRAGQTVALSLTPASVTGTFTARAVDALGRRMDATAAVNGSNVDVIIAASQWRDGATGVGRVELKQVDGGVTSYPVSAFLRIMPGIDAGADVTDYE